MTSQKIKKREICTFQPMFNEPLNLQKFLYEYFFWPKDVAKDLIFRHLFSRNGSDTF